MTTADPGFFHDLAFKEKDNFLRFIHGLGEKKLKRIFKFPGRDFSLWWFSRIAEKPTFKSTAYPELIRMLSGNALQDKQGIRAQLKKNAILNFIRGLYILVKLTATAIYIKLRMKDFSTRKKLLAKSEYILISYFPHLDKNLAKEGIFENAYFPAFHRSLKKEGRAYTDIGIYTEFEGSGLGDAVELANRLNRKQTIFFIDEFFKLSRLPKVFFMYAYFSFRALFNIKWIRNEFVYEYGKNNYNVWKIFKPDFYTSFCGSNLATSLWYIYLFDDIMRRLKKEAKAVYVCEMQWWEKALCISSHDNKITAIGYQHTVAPELLLNYYNTAADFRGRGDVEKCPMPDYLACVGDLPAKRLIEYGWPQDRVFVWGAQRFENLRHTGQEKKIDWKEKGNYFICAFSIDKKESIGLLEFLSEAFKTSGNYRIVLKFHPAMDITAEIKRLGIKMNPAVFDFSKQPLLDSCRMAKGMIVTESSSSFYALANNIPVIIPRLAGFLDCNPLSYISDLPYYAYSPQELKAACDKIISGEASPVHKEKYDNFLNEYFYFPDNGLEYLKQIDKISHLN